MKQTSPKKFKPFPIIATLLLIFIFCVGLCVALRPRLYSSDTVVCTRACTSYIPGSTVFVTSLIMGSFFFMFLLYLITYLLQGNYIANLYLALFGLALFLRSGFIDSKIFLVVFPTFDGYTGFRIECITVPIIACLLMAVASELIPGLFHRYYIIMIYLMSLAFALAFIFADAIRMPQIMTFCYAYYLATNLYGVFTIVRNIRRINLEQGILFAGFLFVLLAAIYDFSYYLAMQSLYIDLPFIFAIANVYFFLCIAASVSISNMKATEAAKLAEDQLAVISHEARTPLAVLASYSGLVALELKNENGNERIIADLDIIVEEAKRVANLIDGMNKLGMNKLALNVEKSKQKQHIILDLGELIEKAAALYRHIFEQSDIRMSLVVDNNLLVLAKPEALTQVLFNILQNAKNHTAQGRVSIIAKEESDYITVSITDTGTGIPSELISRIFERGVSDTKFGRGIGLSICKEIIDAHNGTIQIASEVAGANKGTTAVFTLPRAREDDKNEAV